MTEPPPRLFIGSSAEGRDLGRHLQAELGRAQIDVIRWDQNVFEPSGYVLESLANAAADADFAVLIATPDDVTVSRGQTSSSVRDNIVLEFGFFVGALGRQRTYLLASGDPKLPTDVSGLTRLSYQQRADNNLRVAISEAALQIEERVRQLGRRPKPIATATSSEGAALTSEIDRLCANALAQGWTIRANTATTLRLRAPRGTTHTLSKSRPEATREQLRAFAAELRANGLRVNNSIRRPVAESPF